MFTPLTPWFANSSNGFYVFPKDRDLRYEICHDEFRTQTPGMVRCLTKNDYVLSIYVSNTHLHKLRQVISLVNRVYQ